MILAGKLDLYAKQGDSFHSDLYQYKRGDVPVDLTGATGKCQIRTAANSGVIAELTVVIDNAAEGRYHLEATAATMASLPARGPTVSDCTAYTQDVQFTWASSGYVETFTEGVLYLSPEVTK